MRSFNITILVGSILLVQLLLAESKGVDTKNFKLKDSSWMMSAAPPQPKGLSKKQKEEHEALSRRISSPVDSAFADAVLAFDKYGSEGYAHADNKKTATKQKPTEATKKPKEIKQKKKHSK